MKTTQFTVRTFGIVEHSNGLELKDGFLLVQPADSHDVALQTDDYREAWATANRLSRENGFDGASVHAAGVVIGENDVALVSRCKAEADFGDGTFECSMTGVRPNGFNLAGYHVCNR